MVTVVVGTAGVLFWLTQVPSLPGRHPVHGLSAFAQAHPLQVQVPVLLHLQ